MHKQDGEIVLLKSLNNIFMEKETETIRDGEIVCCGNHVFRVINGQRHWISEPPKDWETIDGRVWDK